MSEFVAVGFLWYLGNNDREIFSDVSDIACLFSNMEIESIVFSSNAIGHDSQAGLSNELGDKIILGLIDVGS